MSQRSKTVTQLGIMAALASIGGAVAYFGVYQPDQAAEKKKSYEDRLFSPQRANDFVDLDAGFANAEFVRLKLAFETETTELTREPGGPWRIVSPVQAKADQLVVNSVVTQLQTQKFKRKLEEDPTAESIQRYGLDSPTVVVEADALVGKAQEKRSVRLELGDENTFDGSLYVRRQGDKAVYQAEGGIRSAMSKTTFELRDKDVMGVDEAAVQSIRLRSEYNQWTLQHLDAGAGKRQWYIIEPENSLADQTNVEAMLSSLRQEKAQRFLEDSLANRARLGFEKPSLRAQLTYVDGGTVNLTLVRGMPDAGLPYARREEADVTSLAEMTPVASGSIDRNLRELRDKSVVTFDKSSIRKAVVHTAEGQDIELEQQVTDAGATAAWVMTSPRPGPAKTFVISSMIWTLAAYKHGALGEEKPKDWAKYGLGDKARSISLFDGMGQLAAKVVFGNEVPEQAPAIYMRGSKNQVLIVDGSRISDLPLTLESLWDGGPLDGGT
jgi:hypothetical protein